VIKGPFKNRLLQMLNKTMQFPLKFCVSLACIFLAISMGLSTLAVASESGTDAESEEDKQQIASPRAWPPRYQDRRFKEDWTPVDWTTLDRSVLPWYDRIKVVPLTKNHSIWAGFGGQVRFRSVFLQSPDFGTSPTRTADSMMLRMRAYSDFHFGDRTRIYLEGIYSDSLSKINGASIPDIKTDNSPEFLNLFGEFDITADADGTTGLWLGRRELQFG
jgi:hypothetical protein